MMKLKLDPPTAWLCNLILKRVQAVAEIKNCTTGQMQCFPFQPTSTIPGQRVLTSSVVAPLGPGNPGLDSPTTAFLAYPSNNAASIQAPPGAGAVGRPSNSNGVSPENTAENCGTQ